MFNFTIPPGARQSFEMSVIDDHIAEDHKEAVYFEIGVYSSGQQHILSDARIYIEDNDGRSIKPLIHTCVVISTISLLITQQ